MYIYIYIDSFDLFYRDRFEEATKKWLLNHTEDSLAIRGIPFSLYEHKYTFTEPLISG